MVSQLEERDRTLSNLTEIQDEFTVFSIKAHRRIKELEDTLHRVVFQVTYNRTRQSFFDGLTIMLHYIRCN